MENLIIGIVIGFGIIVGLSIGILIIPIKKSKAQEAQEEFNRKIEEFWELRTSYESKMLDIVGKLVEYETNKGK